jgi:hypothetical protein
MAAVRQRNFFVGSCEDDQQIQSLREDVISQRVQNQPLTLMGKGVFGQNADHSREWTVA